MQVLSTAGDGTPRLVELTDAELLVSEVVNRLLDNGMSQGDVVAMLLGTRVPEALVSEAPHLDAVLTADFAAYLAQ